MVTGTKMTIFKFFTILVVKKQENYNNYSWHSVLIAQMVEIVAQNQLEWKTYYSHAVTKIRTSTL